MSDDDQLAERPGSRRERKLRTRQALLDAALTQLEDHSFGAISLREVAKAAGITPTGFYRHFESMEELGLVLVDESFRSLREMMRAGRAEVAEPGDEIRTSAAILVRHVHEHHPHYRFIARERSGGLASLRHAIRHEIGLFSDELADDLAGYAVLADKPAEILETAAQLVVTMMVATAEALLDSPPSAEAEIQRTAEVQLRLILVGTAQWPAS